MSLFHFMSHTESNTGSPLGTSSYNITVLLFQWSFTSLMMALAESVLFGCWIDWRKLMKSSSDLAAKAIGSVIYFFLDYYLSTMASYKLFSYEDYVGWHSFTSSSHLSAARRVWAISHGDILRAVASCCSSDLALSSWLGITLSESPSEAWRYSLSPCGSFSCWPWYEMTGSGCNTNYFWMWYGLSLVNK